MTSGPESGNPRAPATGAGSRPRGTPPQPRAEGELTDATVARRLLDDLTLAHRKTPELVRALLLAQELSDDRETAARRAIDEAAAMPWSQVRIDRAVAASIAADEANADELQVTGSWSKHCARIDELAARTLRALAP